MEKILEKIFSHQFFFGAGIGFFILGIIGHFAQLPNSSHITIGDLFATSALFFAIAYLFKK